jgi:hypothetical protein
MMRVICKPCPRRKWDFAARQAAAAFGRPKTRAIHWTPALLRWARRGGRALARAGLAAQLRPAGPSWITRLHLHFNLTAISRVSRVNYSVRVFPTDVRVNRLDLRPRVSAPLAAVSPAARRSNAISDRETSISRRVAARELPSARTSWRKSPAMVVARGLASGRAPVRRAVISRASHSLTLMRTTRVPANHASLERGDASSSFAHSPMRSTPARTAQPGSHEVERASERLARHELAKRRWRTRRAATSSPAPNLPEWVTQSPVDLVWRAAPDNATARDLRPVISRESAHAHAHTQAPTRAEARAQVQALAQTIVAHAPASLPQTTDRAIVCATTLEPALADRLAADVIRRIDHRARIERERRGM